MCTISGPGLGVLTERLVRRGASVLAIEKDDTFAKNLSDAFAHVSPYLQQKLVQSYLSSLTMSMMVVCDGLTGSKPSCRCLLLLSYTMTS